ncbi:MAG: tetraacyldisaccharide 4'-kinase [Tidjanibacter sp.]|nr:tetraacyldisaccharide 4'-kinase [Tidjanibacter sp.]
MGILRNIAAGLYGAGVWFRNWLYDTKILRSQHFDIPIVCVGNLAVGGTGKTPAVEFLIRNLSDSFRIAVLSRGYRRRTKGYIEVGVGDSFLRVGDEPKQIKRKYPEVVVVVCEKRVEGVRRIREEHPEVNLILMDDGFQHRSLSPTVSILLSDYSLPPYKNRMLPAGTLRDSPSQLYRAEFLFVTKTPATMSPIERNIAQKELDPKPYQNIFFTDVRQIAPRPIFSDVAPATLPRGAKVVAMAGVANPERFFDSLEKNYKVVDRVVYGDHHIYKVKEIKQLCQLMASLGEDVYVLTTEKDGVKLTSRKHIPEELQRRLFVVPIELNFRDNNSQAFVYKLKQELKNKSL